MKFYGTAKLCGSAWVIDAEPHVTMMLKRWFKKSDRGIPGHLRPSSTPEICRDLEWFSQRYPLSFFPEGAVKAGADQHRDMVLRLEEYFSPDFRPREFAQMALQPRPYQVRSAEVCRIQGGLLCADELGLGKTCTAITLLADPECRPAVVVPPVHLQRQWAAEIIKFCPMLTVHIVSKGTPYPLPEFFGTGPDVLIVPYSKLAGWAQVLAAYVKTAVFDEAHELRRKGTSHQPSKRWAAAHYLAQKAGHTMGLSATPIFNYGGEIYNVLDCLTPGKLGSRREFGTEWCKPGPNGHQLLKDPRAFGSWARDAGIIVRHTRKEVGRELPPVIATVQTVDADAAALDRLEGDAISLARVILREAPQDRGEKMQASEQFSNQLRQAIGIAKAPFVADFVRMLVEETGEQVLLGGWHRAVYGIWEKKLEGIPLCYYTGTETPAQKEESARRFKAGEARVMFISLRSGAGLEGLQASCKVAVIGELDWSPKVHEQLIGRLHRDGQQEPVLVYYLVAETGADPVISQVLGLKRIQAAGIEDPHGAIVEAVESDPERVKRLAEDYLRRRGLDKARAPEPVALSLPSPALQGGAESP